jgi:dihydrofolate reductase
MGELVVVNHVTLDGVMQSPGRADEDTRGGFTHGGWGAARSDETVIEAVGKHWAAARALVLGRRTYEDFYGEWPKRGGRFAEALTNIQKYVATSGELPWQNSTRLDDVSKLKEGDGDLLIMGSGELIRSLMDEIDRFLLLIHPVALGAGKRLFSDPVELRLVDTQTSPSGVIIATYVP